MRSVTSYSLALRFTLICVCATAICLMLAGECVAKIDPDTVAALWLFNEGKGEVAEDSTGNGNNGKFAGSGPEWVDAKHGKGLEFDGTSWLECGKGESLDFKASTNFSIHAVVKADGAPGGKCIIWKGLGCSTWSQWLLGTGAHENGDGAANAAFHIRVSNGDAKKEVRTKDPLPDGDWVQVCGTYDGSKLKIYIDGILSNEADTGGLPWASPEQVYIGADPGCGNRCQWVGTMYDIKVFNNTLNQADISNLATAVSLEEKLIESWGLIKSLY